VTRAELGRLAAAGLGRPAERPAVRPTPDLVPLAAREGVSALALAGARRLKLDLPPKDEAAMRRDAQAAAARNLALLAAAREIGEAFAAQNIDAILFRGVALIAEERVAPEERPCGDVDLLMRPAELSRAERVLCDELGFKPVCGTDRTFARGAVHVDLHAKSSDLVLPIDLAESRSPVRLDVDALLSRAHPSPVKGFLALDPEPHLVLLAAHAYLVHVLERLAMLVDLARLVSDPRFDARRAMEFATVAGLTRPILFGLRAASQLGLLDMPPAFGDAVAWGLEARLLERALAGRAGRDERYLLAVASRSFPLGYRLRVALKTLVPSRRALRREGEPVDRVGPSRYLLHWLRLPGRLLLR